MSALAKYDQARQALAACRSVDEIKDIRDKSEAMRLYAKQAQDTELEQWAAEIKFRAQRALGELSATLPTQKGGFGIVPTGGKHKAEVLAEAGISTSTANRYEKLAAIPEPIIEEIIAKSKEAGKPVSAKAVLAKAAPPATRARPYEPAVTPLSISPSDTDAEVRPIHSSDIDNADAPDFGVAGAPLSAPAPLTVDDIDDDGADFNLMDRLIAAEAQVKELERERNNLKARIEQLEAGDLAAQIVKLEQDLRVVKDRAERRYNEFTDANKKAMDRAEVLDRIRRAAGVGKDVDLVEWVKQAARRAA